MVDPHASDSDRIQIALHEGLRLVIDPRPDWTPYLPFALAWGCSVLLEGKPVCLEGWMPGVTLHIATRLQPHPGLTAFIEAAWPRACEQVQTWLRSVGRVPCVGLSLPYSQAWMAEAGHTMPPAAMHIEWRHAMPSPSLFF